MCACCLQLDSFVPTVRTAGMQYYSLHFVALVQHTPTSIHYNHSYRFDIDVVESAEVLSNFRSSTHLIMRIILSVIKFHCLLAGSVLS